MRDFTRAPKVIEFQIDDDVFRCHPRLPAQVLIDFALKADKMGDSPTGEQGIQAMTDVLQATLIPEHYARFSARMKDAEHPIDLEQVNEIVPWVMEEYGLRPTEPSGDSSDGPSSLASGTSSTASTPAVGSISASSPSIGS